MFLMQRRIAVFGVLVVVFALMFSGCGLLSGLTRDEKARLITDGWQETLGDLWTEGKAYIAEHPQHQELWKEKVVPAFDIANTTLKDIIDLAQKEDITPQEVEDMMGPLLKKIYGYMAQLGIDLTS